MKIALVGCGNIAATHLRFLKKVRQNDFIYLCDIDRRKAEELKAKFDVHGIYTNFDELLQSETPDAVHILTPLSSHGALARKAIKNGCHVLIEKPVTETAEEYKKISQLASDRNKILCVNYSTIGIPVVIEAIKLIVSGKFGRLIAVHCNYGTSWPGNTIPYDDPNHWSYFLRGGVLQNWVDHPASLVLHVMDSIQEHKILLARRNILPRDCPDLLHVAVRNEAQIGSFTLSLGHGSTDIRAYFLLDGATINVDIRRMLISCIQGRGPQNFIKRALSGIQEGYSYLGGTIKNSFQFVTGKLQREPGILTIINNFYNNIESKDELLVGNKTVLAVTELLDKIWEQIDHKQS